VIDMCALTWTYWILLAEDHGQAMPRPDYCFLVTLVLARSFLLRAHSS